jgi:hypothetical protein
LNKYRDEDSEGEAKAVPEVRQEAEAVPQEAPEQGGSQQATSLQELVTSLGGEHLSFLDQLDFLNDDHDFNLTFDDILSRF